MQTTDEFSYISGMGRHWHKRLFIRFGDFLDVDPGIFIL